MGNGIKLTGLLTASNIMTANTLLGNEKSGVVIESGAHDNEVGGELTVHGNVITGHLEPGVVVDGGGSVDSR